ncbi:MAG: hypothetical protein K2Q10_00550, partial [Rhodospirillales bacterium]|nr:hypothetical protein [Rhodospirillales bacterium]
MANKTKAESGSGEALAIVRGEHRDPFSYLGMHEGKGGLMVRTFQPAALRVWVLDAASGQQVAELPLVREEGLFAGPVPRSGRFAYRLRLDTGAGRQDI